MSASNQMKKDTNRKRSNVVTVRLDSRMKFGLDLASRAHRRSSSSFIEWALEQTFAKERIPLRVESGSIQEPTILDALREVWDVEDADRFVKLATKFPELLTHEEQVLWKLIKEFDRLWLCTTNEDRNKLDTIILPKLRENWNHLHAFAHGWIDADELQFEVNNLD